MSDKVSKGDVLAELAPLDTDALELTLLRAQISLVQAQISLQTAETNLEEALDTGSLELAFTQAQLALKEAEHNLEKVERNQEEALDTGSLELALTRAELALKEAEHNLEKAQEPYTEQDISNARADVDEAEKNLEFAQWKLERATLLREKMSCELEVYRSEQNLDIAQQELDTILSGPDEDEIAILESRVEIAKQSLEQAQKQLDEATIIAPFEVYRAQQNLNIAQQKLDTISPVPDEDEVAIKEMGVETANQSLEQTQKSLEQAQEQLDNETLTAPWDGVVASVGAEVGDTFHSSAAAGTVIVHLIDPSSIELKVQVDEIDIPKIKLNQRAVVSIDALPGIELDGGVTAISPVPATTSGVILYDVTTGLTVPEATDLRIGMSATANIIIEERSNVLLVPTQAIKQDRQGNSIVIVQAGEELQPRLVVTGLSDGLRTEILDGLSEGEIVVIEMGTEVQPSLEPSGRPGVIPGMPTHPGVRPGR